MSWLIQILSPLRRRGPWIDWVLTRLEAYTALLDQWGIRPSFRTIVELVMGVVLGAWAILSELWVPVGLAIALVVPAVLWSARQRGDQRGGQAPIASTATQPTTVAKRDPQTDRTLLMVVNYLVYQSALLMLDSLLKEGPKTIH